MKASNTQISLFALRLGVFTVFFVWALDKFLDPAHTASVFARFYKIDNLGHEISYILGALQMIFLFAFLAGIKKRLTYGAVLVMHFISTLSTWQFLIAPYANPRDILFMAAIPMLSACLALYLMRNEDTLFTLKKI